MTKAQMQAEIRRLKRAIRDRDRMLATVDKTSATLRDHVTPLLPNRYETRED